MNEEAAFQKHLDAHPDDATCRLVFADWLEEQADSRAEGYRALGTAGIVPVQSGDGRWDYYQSTNMPLDWYTQMVHMLPNDRNIVMMTGSRYASRHAAEDAAALAFARLPPERRAELLGFG